MGKQKPIFEHVTIPDSESFVCRHFRVSINKPMPFHFHPEWEISWVIRGTGDRIVGNSLEPIVPGEIIILPPEIPHRWVFDPEKNDYTENITLQFPSAFFEKLQYCFAEFEMLDKARHHFRAGAIVLSPTAEKARELIKRIDESSGEQRFMSMLSLLTFLYHARDYRTLNTPEPSVDTRGDSRIRKVIGHISANYSQPLSLDDIAAVACMNRTAFCTFFKKITRQSFVDYLTQFRVQKATELLRNTNRPIAEIAGEVGFNDVPHFNRVFKKVFSMTPSAYRNQHNN